MTLDGSAAVPATQCPVAALALLAAILVRRHGRASGAPDRTSYFEDDLGAKMNKPTLYLTVGLPGTGKTTAARRIETEQRALRLTKDEWMKALFGKDNPSSASDVIEGRLIRIGMRALELGTNVVIDYGLWSRDERSALRQAAADVGAAVVILYCEATPAEQRERLGKRLAESPEETWPISEKELLEWAATFDVPTPGEIDGSDPIGDPAGDFATWRDWMDARWPARVAPRG